MHRFTSNRPLSRSAQFLVRGLQCWVLAWLLAAVVGAQTLSVPLPDGASPLWDQMPVEELAPGRARVVLNGLWRFQPAGNGPIDAAAVPDAWGWIRVPGSWVNLREWPVWRMPGVVVAAAPWKSDEYSAVGAAWHEREITVPASWAGRAIVLQLSRVSTDALVFVDGKKAGEIGWPSGEVDVTALVKPGQTHQLRILVRATPQAGEIFNLMDFNSGSAAKAKLKTRGLIDDVILACRPSGARVDGVFVQTSVRKRELALRVELAEWAGDTPVRIAARVLAWPSGQEIQVLPEQTLPVSRSAAEPGLAVATPSWNWIAPKLWEIGQPVLYTLELAVRAKGDATPRDTFRERFGFREFWIEGKAFYLNGQPLRLRPFYVHNDDGLSGVREAVDTQVGALLAHGFNFWEVWPRNWNIRGEAQFNRIWTESADERGLALSLPFAHPGEWMGGDMWHGRVIPEKAFAAWEPVLRAEWRRYRNHPSVLMWVGYPNMFSHGDDQNPRRLGQRADELANGNYGSTPRMAAGMRLINTVKELDPTRPATTHHGGPTGDFQTINHYLNLMPLQEREEHLSEWAQQGDMPLMSVEFGVPFSLTFTRGRNGYGGARSTEPLVTEHAAAYLGAEAYALEADEYRANLARRFQRDQTYQDVDNADTIFGQPAFQRVVSLFTRNTWRSWRTWGITGGMIPWSGGYTWTGTPGEIPLPAFKPGRSGVWFPAFSKRTLYFGPPEAGRLTEAGRVLTEVNGPTLAWIAGPAPTSGDPGSFTIKDSRFFSGAQISKSAVLINDSREPQSFNAEVVARLDGVEVAREAWKGKIAVGENRIEPFRFKAPVVNARQRGELTLTARIGGHAHEDRFTFEVLPSTPKPAPDRPLVVWDPQGATSAMLATLGYRLKKLATKEAPAALPVGQTVIVGQRAWDTLTPEARAAFSQVLLAHAQSGGRVVLFAQSPETVRSAGFRVARVVSRRFWPVPTQRDHPILAGLEASDFTDWAGAGALIEPMDAPMPDAKGPRVEMPVWGYRWGTRGSVSSAAIEKPHRSAWTPILEGEFDLAYSPLMERRHGQGMLWWCQLDVEGRTELEPAAARLVTNLISHAATVPLAPAPTASTRYVGGETGAALLRFIGVVFEPAASLEPGAGLVVVGPDATPPDDVLLAHLKEGGRLVFLPREAGALPLGPKAEMLKKVGAVQSADLPAWEELRGLSVSDLRLRASLPAVGVVPAAGTEVAGGGLIARVSVGPGRALFLQIDPRTLPADTKTYYRYSQWRWTRALAQLLANAGARFALDQQWAPQTQDDPFAPALLAGTWRAALEQKVEEGTPDPGNLGKNQGWQAADFDDAGWKPIAVPGQFDTLVPEWANLDGAVWYRREFTLPTAWAGRDLVLNLGVIDDADTTYLNGHQIGRTVGEKSWSETRRYKVPAWALKPGRNVLAIRVYDQRGGGGFVSKPESLTLEVVNPPVRETLYAPGFRTDHALGDDPWRYYRW